MSCDGRLGHVFPAHSVAGERCACGEFVRNDSIRGLMRAAAWHAFFKRVAERDWEIFGQLVGRSDDEP